MEDIFKSLEDFKKNMEIDDRNLTIQNDNDNDNKNLLLFLGRFIKNIIDDRLEMVCQQKFNQWIENSSLENKIIHICQQYINKHTTEIELKNLIRQVLKESFQ